VAAGYEDDGAPDERLVYRPDYYGAFLRDPDGDSVEALHHGDTRRGGNIEHLWIGVRDLGAAEAFYRATARHTRLARATGRPEGCSSAVRGRRSRCCTTAGPTKHLHHAFPAPDRTTVEQFHGAALAAGYHDNGRPGDAPTTAAVTTRPSSSIRTAPTWSRCTAAPVNRHATRTYHRKRSRPQETRDLTRGYDRSQSRSLRK
jgi:hypothetical protein